MNCDVAWTSSCDHVQLFQRVKEDNECTEEKNLETEDVLLMQDKGETWYLFCGATSSKMWSYNYLYTHPECVLMVGTNEFQKKLKSYDFSNAKYWIL